MTISWLTCSLCFTLIGFLLKYFPGNIFFNGLMSCCSELAGFTSAGIAYARYGSKRSLFTFYGIAAAGSILIIGYMHVTGYYEQEIHVFTTTSMLTYGVLLLVAKFGISAAFNVIYCCNSEMFPALFAVTAFGISNFFARCCTFFAPQIAEIQSTTPMLIFTFLSLLAMGASTFI